MQQPDRNTPPIVTQTWQDVLHFWFGTPDSPDYGQPRKAWFVKDPEFDARVRSQFLRTYERAAAGECDDWQRQPHSCLALLVVLDQFPRNLFRGTPRAFATDDRALEIAERAIAQNFDAMVLPVQRWFVYLPLEHCEDIDRQNHAVAKFETLRDDPDSASAIDYARRHRQVIEQFGRFPHRNDILGRDSTPEEQAFLQQPGSRF